MSNITTAISCLLVMTNPQFLDMKCDLKKEREVYLRAKICGQNDSGITGTKYLLVRIVWHNSYFYAFPAGVTRAVELDSSSALWSDMRGVV